MDFTQLNKDLQGQMIITQQPYSGIGEIVPLEPPMQMQQIGSLGLTYLTTVDQLKIKQKIEIFEMLVGFETQNKYEVLNPQGQLIFKAKEHSGCMTRLCCGTLRPFEMSIRDIYGTDTIALNRPMRCKACCFPCCLQELEISAPPGNLVGSIKQNWSCFPSFDVKDVTGTTVLQIKGPLIKSSCCGDVVFKLQTMNGDEIGRISKKWSGFLKEAFTDADNFGIHFPIDLDVNMKATVLGAAFLIDFMYFEQPAKKRQD